jgi:MoxR-like ATPase
MDTNEQILLRVRRGSDFDKIFRYMVDEERTEDEFKALAGNDTQTNFFRRVIRNADNLQLAKNGRKNKMIYMNPVPSAPQSVGVDVTVHQGAMVPSELVSDITGQRSVYEPINDMTWPQMPPVPIGMGDIFRKPSYFETMRAMVKLNKHISLAGAPGTGKDTSIIELAALEGQPLVTVGGDGGLRKRDLVGTTEIINGSTTFKVAEFAAAVVYGWWASITEINAADPDVLLLLNATMAQPYVININGKAYPVHSNFRLFVSYNPGLIGTKPLPQSFKDRFFSIQVPFYNRQQLRSLLEANGMPDLNVPWTTKIVDFGMAMWSAYERGQMRYQISVRRLMDAVVLMNMVVDVKDALAQAVLSAIDSPTEFRAAKAVLETL